MFEILKEMIEENDGIIIMFEDGFNVIVDENNEMTIRDILSINRINWCFDMDNDIWVDWDNLPF